MYPIRLQYHIAVPYIEYKINLSRFLLVTESHLLQGLKFLITTLRLFQLIAPYRFWVCSRYFLLRSTYLGNYYLYSLYTIVLLSSIVAFNRFYPPVQIAHCVYVVVLREVVT